MKKILESIGDERYRFLGMEEDYYYLKRNDTKVKRKQRKILPTIKYVRDDNDNDLQNSPISSQDHTTTPDKTNDYKIAKKRRSKGRKMLRQVRMINFESDKTHLLSNRRDEHITTRQRRTPRQKRIDNDTDDDVPSAESLGIQDGPLYERLVSIIQGDDITPEDYDLLLLLDNNNEKKTMNDKEISQISTVLLGGENSNIIENWGSSTCDICLESFKDLQEGTEVRHLPCNHVFCKKCIDYWFSEVSMKCPNLSCYWQTEI